MVDILEMATEWVVCFLGTFRQNTHTPADIVATALTGVSYLCLCLFCSCL